MLDLNGFKSINDIYGHAVGDHALLEAAKALKLACAKAPCGFFLCRYGGDEFILAGSGLKQSEIDETKQLIRQQLALVKHSGSTAYKLSASMGTASLKCTDEATLECLFRQADESMYKEKEEYRAQSKQSNR